MVTMVPTGKSLPVCKQLLSREILRTLVSTKSLRKLDKMQPKINPTGPELKIKAANQEKKVSKVNVNQKIKARVNKEAQIRDEREKVRITMVQLQLNHNHPFSLRDFAEG